MDQSSIEGGSVHTLMDMVVIVGGLSTDCYDAHMYNMYWTCTGHVLYVYWTCEGTISSDCMLCTVTADCT